MTENMAVTLTTRQEIKMGFIGSEADDDKFDHSLFRSTTEMTLAKHIRGMERRGQGSTANLFKNQKLGKRVSVDRKAKSQGWTSKFASHTTLTDQFMSTVEDKIARTEQSDFEWWRKLATIDERKVLRNRQAGLFGPLGTLCAMAQNEWLMTGGSPLDEVMFTMKACNSCFTIITVWCIFRIYYLTSIERALHLHVHEFRESVSNVGHTWLLSVSLWIEVLLVSIHNPPFYTDDYALSDMGRINVYVMRSETLMASFNMLRLYLFWRVIRDWMVSDLPKRRSLAGFQRLHIGSAFAIKRMLNSWYSLAYLTTIWFCLLFLLSYWFRAVEVTACQLPGIPASELNPRCASPGASEWNVAGSSFLKVNDYYMYNAMWFMIVTSTSVGYGDIVPTTSMGRTVAAIAAIVGLVCLSLMTASMANILQWSGDEANANVLLKREIARLKRREMAAVIIQNQWRRRQGTHGGEESFNIRRMSLIMKNFTREACTEIDDAAGKASKIENAFKKLKGTEAIMSQFGQMLWMDDALQKISDGKTANNPRKVRNAEQERQMKIRMKRMNSQALKGVGRRAFNAQKALAKFKNAESAFATSMSTLKAAERFKKRRMPEAVARAPTPDADNDT